ncbi:MAG: AraC family transcriptional regulator ligand-binding domain-containing protein [Kangiellaceae bacterium]|nr:AraC family transcriptional regulator ligand-binding domain-containing protein [Kangiellaceae bacterium]
MHLTKNLTQSNATVIPVLTFVESKGYNIQNLLQSSNLNKNFMDDYNGRIAIESVDILFNNLAQLLELNDFGLKAGAVFATNSSSILHHLLIACGTLRKSIQYLKRFKVLFTDEIAPDLLIEGNTAILRYYYQPPSYPISPYRIEAAILSATYWLRIICGKRFSIDRVAFQFKQPLHIDSYRKLLRSTVAFEQSHYEIHFNKRWLDEIVRRENPIILSLLEAEAQYLKNEIKDGKVIFVRKLQGYIRNGQLDYNCSVKDAAQLLGVSARTVVRRLATENISFKKLVIQERIRFAKELLSREYCIDEVAIKTGYSCRRTFERAFIRMVNISPAQFKNR